MSFRLDVRENLEAAAAAELEFHGCYVALIAQPIVDENLGSWSDPVQLQFTPNADKPGILEITARRYEPPDTNG